MSDWTSTASGDRKKERRLGIEGVCASWFPEHNPRQDEVLSDGTAVWKYVISVYNPGQFPISQIEVDIRFAMDVRRVRGQHLDDASDWLRLRQPVIAGGASRPWNRYLRIDYAAASRLRETTANVKFIDSEGKHHEDPWPKQLAGRA